jgi:hypothetical protein
MRLALLAIAVLVALTAGTAKAATYTVRACDGPGGTGANRIFAPFGGAGATCDYGTGLHARLDSPLPAGSAGGLAMTAPAGTSIYGY